MRASESETIGAVGNSDIPRGCRSFFAVIQPLTSLPRFLEQYDGGDTLRLDFAGVVALRGDHDYR
jgi:hypothetical protein